MAIIPIRIRISGISRLGIGTLPLTLYGGAAGMTRSDNTLLGWRARVGAGSGGADDDGAADDLAGEVEVHLSVIAERSYLGVVRLEALVSESDPEVMENGVGRNGLLVQGECKCG